MAHFNVSIFCSLQGPVQGPPRQKRSQDPLSLLCHGHGITYNNLYDMTEEARRRRMCATRWKFGQGRKREKTLKGRGNSKHVKSRSTADAGFFFFFYDPPSEVVIRRLGVIRRHPWDAEGVWADRRQRGGFYTDRRGKDGEHSNRRIIFTSTPHRLY